MIILDEDLFGLIEEALGLDTGTVNLESSNKNIPEWDSLGHFAVLSAIDEKYGDVSIENPSITNATSVAEILEEIRKS